MVLTRGNQSVPGSTEADADIVVPAEKKRKRVVSQVVKYVDKDGSECQKQLTVAHQPGVLVELISNLTDAQKKDVEAIGFGSLLKLQLKKFPLGTDGETKIRCCPRSVPLRQIGLPTGGERVPLEVLSSSGVSKNDKAISERRQAWKTKFQIEGDKGISLSMLWEAMENCPEGGEDFTRYFVLYAVTCFLSPVSSKDVDMQVLKAVENVSDIKNLDWCEFVYSKLSKGVQRYYTTKYTAISGCVLVLIVQFLQHALVLGKSNPVALPLLQHWSHEKVNQRCQEINGRKYERAPLTSDMYPLTRHGKLLKHASVEDDCSKQEVKENLNVGGFTIPLSGDIKTDDEIKSLGLKTAEEGPEFFKRDLVVATSRLMECFNRAQAEKREVNASPDSEEEVWGSQEFWYDPNFHKMMDDVYKHARKKAKTRFNFFDLHIDSSTDEELWM